MKPLKIILSVCAGLIIVCVALLGVFLATFDISRYKSQITQELSSLLHRELRIEQLRLDFQLDKGLTIVLKGLSMEDDPAFSTEKMLTVDQIYLNMDIRDLIFQRHIAIAKIEVSGLNIHLVRNKTGALNAQAVANKSAPETMDTENFVKTSAGISASVSQNNSNGMVVIPQMLIQAVRIKNGAFTFVDESVEPPLTIFLRQIDLQATRVSLERSFPFQAKVSLWADQQNITADGEIKFDLRNNQVHLQRAKLETDLSQSRLTMMPFYVVLKEQLSLGGDIQGKVSLRNITMQIGQNGLGAFAVDGELTGGKVSFEWLPQPLAEIHGRFHADESNIAISELSVSQASGIVNAQGRWSDYGRANMLMLDLKVDGVQLGELIPRAQMPVLSDNGKPLGIEGGIYAVLDAEGHGTQIPVLLGALHGDGSVEIRGGKLLNINFLRFVLDKLSFIPDLAQKVSENLPQRYKDRLDSQETPFRVASTIKFKDQLMLFNAELQAEGFAITANGNLGLDQTLALTADFFILKDLAASMIASVPELSYLLDAGGRIHVPFKPYRGKLQDIRLYPDVEDLARKVVEDRGKEELRKAIFKALDVEQSPGASARPLGQDPSPEQEVPKEEPRPEKILIEGIFDAIFKGQETP